MEGALTAPTVKIIYRVVGRHVVLDSPGLSHDGRLTEGLEPPPEFPHQHRRPAHDLHGAHESPAALTRTCPANPSVPGSQLLHTRRGRIRAPSSRHLRLRRVSAEFAPANRPPCPGRRLHRPECAGDAPLGGDLRHRRAPVHVEVDVRMVCPDSPWWASRPQCPREPRPGSQCHPKLGFRFLAPRHRETGPADVRKAGSSFDLPIAASESWRQPA
jgi:hypothetical protein